VTVTVTDVPPGIDQAAHEAGIASSPANLASYVEGSHRRSTVRWTRTQTSAEAAAWLTTHLNRGSAIVAEVDGEVAGFAVYGPWKDFDGFCHTVENSV
jgi:L-amino acid N-acyltransferase YncA